jgi:putative tricarboxylic transport membrane protein
MAWILLQRASKRQVPGLTMKANALRFIAGHPDRISGIVLCAAGAVLLCASSALPFGTLSAPDAGFFPRVLAGGMLLSGVALFIRAFRIAPETLDFTGRSWSVAATIALLFAYGALLERVGFLISTIGLLLVLMKVYGSLGWKLSLLIAVPSVVATYLVFTQLGVALPAGLLSVF